MAKGHYEHEGSGTTNSSDGTSHTSAASTLSESTATPYQQTVHPPAKTMGLGVTFDSSATKPAPTDSQDTNVHRRQAT